MECKSPPRQRMTTMRSFQTKQRIGRGAASSPALLLRRPRDRVSSVSHPVEEGA